MICSWYRGRAQPRSGRGRARAQLASDAAPARQLRPAQPPAAHLPARRLRHHLHAVLRHLPLRWRHRPVRIIQQFHKHTKLHCTKQS